MKGSHGRCHPGSRGGREELNSTPCNADHGREIEPQLDPHSRPRAQQASKTHSIAHTTGHAHSPSSNSIHRPQPTMLYHPQSHRAARGAEQAHDRNRAIALLERIERPWRVLSARERPRPRRSQPQTRQLRASSPQSTPAPAHLARWPSRSYEQVVVLEV